MIKLNQKQRRELERLTQAQRDRLATLLRHYVAAEDSALPDDRFLALVIDRWAEDKIERMELVLASFKPTDEQMEERAAKAEAEENREPPRYAKVLQAIKDYNDGRQSCPADPVPDMSEEEIERGLYPAR